MEKNPNSKLKILNPKGIILGFLILGLVFSLSWVFAQDLRIVSLAPSTTEILFALGLGRNIVGVDSFSNYPSPAENIEKVGTFSQPSLEKIISLKPDIIFTTGLEQNSIILKLRRAGLKVFIADPENIKELFQNVLEIGKITTREEEAKNLVFHLEQELLEIQSELNRIDVSKRPKVFLEIWYPPLITCGNSSYLDEMISLAGGINIARNIKRKFSRISEEFVIKNSPDVIIRAYMYNGVKNENNLSYRYGWNVIRAVKNNRIYADIDPDILLRPGPRIIEGIKQLFVRFYGKETSGE
ncbi:MAG: cobalamin-binding protein [Candidatus Omnitrophica bacterium]|nr:cobalamin-binding protein [Candidatus Omnitrophota bacterium]